MGVRYNLSTLRDMWEGGQPVEDIAKFFGREPQHIRLACWRHGFRRSRTYKSAQATKARAGKVKA